MYLTDDEYKVLSGIIEGLPNHKIEEKYGIKMGTNDPRIVALMRKYGVNLYSDNYRKEIRDKADLSKTEVTEKEEMPYFEYIGSELADYIDINKRDVEQLVKYFSDKPDGQWTHTHRLYRTQDGLGTFLYIKDLSTGKMSKLRANIDGEDCLDDEIKKRTNSF